jgi:glycosyltransferase involved in cell wall biosynthesis
MLVSVVIPYFKSEKYIEQAINSVLKQKYKNWELIIIDDEVSNFSKDILQKIKKKIKNKIKNNIKIIYNNKNFGAAISRNIGISVAKGKYVAFLDSDDSWNKNKLYEQIKLMKNKNAKIGFTSYKVLNELNKPLYTIKANFNLDYNELLKKCPICTSSVVIVRHVLKKNNFRDLKTKEDYELWLRLSSKFIFFGIDKVLTNYRSRKNTLSSNHLNKICNAFYIYNSLNNFNFIQSIYFVVRLYLNAFIKKFL